MKKFTTGIAVGFSAVVYFFYRQLGPQFQRKFKRVWLDVICPISEKLISPKVARKFFSCREPAGAPNTPEYSNGIY